jgi:hypothetical protein
MGIDRLGPNVTPSLPQRPDTATHSTRDARIDKRQPLDIAQTQQQPNRAGAPAPASNALPAEPPAGTDPELWAVLSSSERTYFAKVGAMGPLTYGRVITETPNAPSPAARGGRLDIRG